MNTSVSRRQIRSVALVINPHSGHGRGLAAATAAAALFAEHGMRVREIRGADAADTVALVRAAVQSADRPDAVVCAGGDGLVCVTVQALAGTDVALGLLPGGTGNDLARELGVPKGDSRAAAEIVLGGVVRTIDLGVIEEPAGSDGPHPSDPAAVSTLPRPMRFATVAATGFDARVTLRANRMRRPKGSLRYSCAAVPELLGQLAVPFRIELSGGPEGTSPRVIETDAVMVAVGNTRTYGGGMLICPDAILDDGLLDLTVVGAMSRAQLIRMLPALAAGRRVEHPAVTHHRAQAVTVAADVPATADGDPAERLPATFRADPGALSVLVPH
ncbi:YegS/Rv2252/BmrU family lipid kinase [Nocardia vermiculata]|uniref:YegS/Rv2252/BmrU family lipid kinase n=1 Tax=Nocardia vermiculata TaxID=257274 RepID=A0A846XRK1_9NOCA|nr:YegS/Rv2252/BmrU family lipid kinase [Nocardia vermiculata]NKY49227.1 YegS/Rv2252/BmrU family lipid kinase [Nocardia vermiculata]